MIILFIFWVVFLIELNKLLPEHYRTFAYLMMNVLSFFTALTILFGNKKIESKIAWVIFVLFAPIIGFLFYIILGVEYNRFKKFDPKLNIDQVIDKVLEEQKENTKFEEKIGDRSSLIQFIEQVGHFPLCLHSTSTILTNGPEKFKYLIKELKEAKQFSHMEYFILKEGNLLEEITEILEQKSREGVSVRILYDDFGCVDLSNTYLKRLHQNQL